jgi:hypothetical protein
MVLVQLHAIRRPRGNCRQPTPDAILHHSARLETSRRYHGATLQQTKNQYRSTKRRLPGERRRLEVLPRAGRQHRGIKLLHEALHSARLRQTFNPRGTRLREGRLTLAGRLHRLHRQLSRQRPGRPRLEPGPELRLRPEVNQPEGGHVPVLRRAQPVQVNAQGLRVKRRSQRNLRHFAPHQLVGLVRLLQTLRLRGQDHQLHGPQGVEHHQTKRTQQH